MPQLNVTTKSAEKVWSSPDGQKTIYKVSLDADGQSVQAKTYSNAIAQEGWSGTVETYEKEGRMGSETFVKQPPKEGGWSGGSTAGYAGPRGAATSGKKDFDNFTMYLSYAKDLVVALQNTSGFDETEFSRLLTATIKGGEFLYEGRPGAEPKQESQDTVVEPTKEELDGMFGGL